MIEEQFYIYKKEVDWPALQEGFSIPVSIQVISKEQFKTYLKRGEKRDINVLLDKHTYQVKLINQAFDEQKYPGHSDILQIRYSPQSPFAIKLREIFKSSLDYLRRKELMLRELYEYLKKGKNILSYTQRRLKILFSSSILLLLNQCKSSSLSLE
jgi:hypothetical protein